MRLLKGGVAAALAATVLLSLSSVASAQIDQVTIGQPALQRDGTVTVSLTYTCDVGVNAAFANVTVRQVSGHKLANGSGSFFSNFPGVPCTGSPQTFTGIVVDSFTSFVYKNGRATVSGTFTAFDPDTGQFFDEVIEPVTVRLHKARP